MIRSATIAMLISLSVSLILVFAIHRFFWYKGPFSREMGSLIIAVSTMGCALVVMRTFFWKLSWEQNNYITAAIVSLVAAFSYPNTEGAQSKHHSQIAITDMRSAESRAPEAIRQDWMSKLYSLAISITSWLHRAFNRTASAISGSLASCTVELKKRKSTQAQDSAAQYASIGSIANVALDYGIDLALDWSSPLMLTPFVEWTEPSINNALNSVMRLLTLPQVMEDEAMRCKLVEIQRCLHAASRSILWRDQLSPEERRLFDERLRERVVKLNVILRG